MTHPAIIPPVRLCPPNSLPQILSYLEGERGNIHHGHHAAFLTVFFNQPPHGLAARYAAVRVQDYHDISSRISLRNDRIPNGTHVFVEGGERGQDLGGRKGEGEGVVGMRLEVSYERGVAGGGVPGARDEDDGWFRGWGEHVWRWG